MKKTLTQELQQFYQTLCEVEKLGGLKESDKERFGDVYRRINEFYIKIEYKKKQAEMGTRMAREQKDPKMENSFYKEYRDLSNIMKPTKKAIDMLDCLLSTVAA